MILVLGGSIVYYVTFSLPSVQRWLGGVVASAIGDGLGTRVTIESIDASMPFHPILNGVTIYDQRGDTLLDASRASTRLYLLPLLEGRYEIGHVQLYRPDVRVRKDSVGLNCQFVLDLFANDSRGGSKTNLHINTILLRRGTVSFTSVGASDAAAERRFVIGDLSVTVNRLDYVDKELSASLTDMDMTIDGRQLRDMSGTFVVGREGGRVSDLSFELGANRISAINAEWGPAFSHWQVSCSDAVIDRSSLPSALSLPTMRLDALAEGSDSTAVVRLLDVHGNQLDMHLTAAADLRTMSIDVDTLRMDIGRSVLEHTARALYPTLLADSVYQPLISQDIALAVSGRYSPEHSWMKATLNSDIATVDINATVNDLDQWHIDIDAPQVSALPLLRPLLVASVGGDDSKASLRLSADGSLSRRSLSRLVANGSCDSRPVKASFDVNASHEDGALLATLNVDRFNTEAFAATRPIRRLQTISMGANANLRWTSLNDVLSSTGQLHINNLHVTNDTLCVEPLMDKLAIGIIDNGGGERHAYIRGDVVNGFASLATQPTAGRKFNVSLQISDTHLLNRMAGTNMTLLGNSLVVKLENDSVMQTTVRCDSLKFGNHRFNDIYAKVVTDMNAPTKAERTTDALLHLCRQTRFGLTDIDLNARLAADSLLTNLNWASLINSGDGVRRDSANCGTFSLTAQLADTTLLRVNPTTVMLDGERWSVCQGTARLQPDGAMTASNITMNNGERYARINGRMSRNLNDTLRVEMREFSLDYIFGLTHVRDLDLGGNMTGTVNVTGGVANPQARGLVSVPDFTFNGAQMGFLLADIRWDTSQMQLGIDGRCYGSGVRPRSPLLSTTMTDIDIDVNVSLVPGHNHLDLRVDTRGANLAFLSPYTRRFFGEVFGAGTGNVHVHGPFRKVVIDGQMHIDQGTINVPMIGGVFHITGADVVSREGMFTFNNIRAYDKDATRVGDTHLVTGGGTITHSNYKNIAYDFTFNTHGAKIYDVPDYGDQRFRGTGVLDAGRVQLSGQPGRVNVDVNGRAVRGSFFEYNNASPEGLVNSDFITFVDSRKVADAPLPTTYNMGPDINLNLTVGITPEATIDVLMDSRTGDKISLHGQGSINVGYYNKGALKMNGTYNVIGGSYAFSIPGIVRRELKFSQGGTIDFAESPMQAKLNLQAVYSTPVDLNTLSGGNLFSSARTDVDCIMNIGGNISAPQVTFDFDLPNASNEERAMVRSLVGTEEERDMQAIYLLGFNSFYTLGDDVGSARGNMAVNGFLSGAISSQLNTFLSNAMGNSNWNFGTNISTGQMGWGDVQAEGSVSGQLFNNRLLVNGKFGYRDGSSLSQHTGFVGDFDLQWKFTNTGTISLKAYSQTTDRYFTKSALTTQGVGIILKKDFNTLRDLFGIKRRLSPAVNR